MTDRAAAIDYSDAPYRVRPAFGLAHAEYWRRLAQPGAWWTGGERVAIAAETRAAWSCRLCASKKAALTPDSVTGSHDSAGEAALPEAAIEAIHRLVSDASRISGPWVKKLFGRGLSDGQYVEIIGTVVAVLSIDSFCLALGIPVHPLPEPAAGEISRYRPESLDHDTAFVPMLKPEVAGTPEEDLWSPAAAANVIRALSLVPDEVRTLQSLSSAHYLGGADIGDPKDSALSRPQMELVAGRVSALNECFY